jgi:predicted signal transduction protein with EAL and GGDEF domain
MGADEFAMLCPAADLGEALAKAQDLREALGRPYLLAGLTVEVGVSVGVSVAPEHAHTGGALMQRADVALSHAKGTGRPVSSYLPSMEQATVHRLQLATQLREAIGDGQVQVHYQPKLALASRDVVGVEALVRWQHPEYGAVMPDEFVPLAERTGLIGPLTRHVLKTALTQCRSWLDRDMQIAVAVNLSVKNLLDTAFPESVFALLEEFGVPAGLLTFEITESSVMSDPERSLPVLHRLHEHGIGLSIDDFGTGYSSLAYLRRLPVDEVKIDKVFVLGMGTDLGDMAIVRAIVELGRSLTLKVVAEGVEDELARDLLSGMGCDVIQGFLVSRALPAERLDTWLAARTSLGPLQPGVPGRRPQLTG